MSEKVTRALRIRVQYLDENLQAHDEWVEGYLARVIQHEFDHLEGKMYVDRVTPLRKQLIRNKLRSIMQGKFNASYRVKQIRK
jgi:peptide deformylase